MADRPLPPAERPDPHPADARRRAARERERLEVEIDRLEGLVADRTDKLARARTELERIKADPVIARLVAVRSGVRRASSTFTTRLPGKRSADDRARRTWAAEQSAAAAWLVALPGSEVAVRILAAHGAGPPLPSPCPLISIVVTGSDEPGQAGGGGSASSTEIRARTGWPNIEWLSSSTAGDGLLDALSRAAGDYVCFLPSGVVPAEPGWLGRLVAGVDSLDAAAGSPRLLGIDEPAPGSTPAVRLIARGMAFAPGPGMPVPELLGAGENPFGPAAELVGLRAVPGSTGLLLRRAVVAGLHLPPIADPDELAIEVGLRLRERGLRVAYVGSSVLWQRSAPGNPGRASTADWLHLHARWGPRLHREVWRDAFHGPREWASRPLRAAVVAAPGPRAELQGAIADAFLGRGWLVSPTASEASLEPDVAVVTDPAADLAGLARHVVKVGWITEPTAAWTSRPAFDDLDLLVADASAGLPASVGGRPVVPLEGPAGLPGAIAGWLEQVRFAIHIGPPDWAAAARWGDTPFGRAVARQLEALGNPASLVVHAERDDPIALRADVALHIVGTRRLALRPAQVSLLWIISHPDAVRAARCAAYDVVFVASDPFLDHLAAQVSVPLVALHQATDPDRFWPEPGGPPHELLFVGNSRNRHRPVLDALAGTERDLAVYGGNWRPDLLDPRFLKGDWIPNGDVHRAYAAAAIVLNDHWSDMRDEGFISNRIYDVLASGGFVLSDPVDGLEREFDGAVATWTDGEDLRASVERYLADPELRRAMAERGRAVVLARHTFAHRAQALVEAARPHWAERPRGIAPATENLGDPVRRSRSS